MELVTSAQVALFLGAWAVEDDLPALTDLQLPVPRSCYDAVSTILQRQSASCI